MEQQNTYGNALEIQRRLILSIAKSPFLHEMRAISEIKKCIESAQSKDYFPKLLEQIDPTSNRKLMSDLDLEPLRRLFGGLQEYLLMETRYQAKV